MESLGLQRQKADRHFAVALDPAPRARPSWRPVLVRLGEIAVVAAVYYGAARLGLVLAFQQTNVSPVWPPSGIAFAAVLLRGYRVWPGILIGAFLANAAVFAANNAADPTTLLAASACIALGNTLEAVTGTFLLRRLGGAGNPLGRARDVFHFVSAALLMCLTSCTVGSSTLCLLGIVPRALYGTIWFTWWLGDAGGVLVLTPVLLAWWRSPAPRPRLGPALEALLFLVLVLATGQVVFGSWFRDGVAPYALAFTLIPFLVWAAFRFGQRGVACSTLLVAGIAVWGTIHGFGPFVRETANESLLLLQAFVGISTVTGLVLAAVLSERRRADDELRSHAAQLEAANKELEAFAYSVSHDLRTPLRSIEGFSQVLMEDCADQLDEEGKQALGRVRAAAQRMAQLIDDLLNLSRVTRGEMRREAVDLSAVARALAAELRQRDPQRPSDFVIADGLTAQGDPRLLRVVLDNLLSNAWKFTAKKPRARIEFGVTEAGGGPAFFVRDNGAGFDVAYAGKLFGAFQRLHGVHEFPGTGIGLATVQRIVHRHGGRAWAHGEVENGATIYFTL